MVEPFLGKSWLLFNILGKQSQVGWLIWHTNANSKDIRAQCTHHLPIGCKVVSEQVPVEMHPNVFEILISFEILESKALQCFPYAHDIMCPYAELP